MSDRQFVIGVFFAMILLAISLILLGSWVSVPRAEGLQPTAVVDCRNEQGTPVACATLLPSYTPPPVPTPEGTPTVAPVPQGDGYFPVIVGSPQD
jgi:hypothetical protein